MPSRYIRDGLLDSAQVERAGEAAEVLFVRLMLVADDYGRFDGRARVIVNKCWPNGGPSEEEIETRLTALEAAKKASGPGLIVRYQVHGAPYLWIPKFGQRTRAKKSKYPDPPQDSPQPADERPADDSQPSGKWRAPDGHPQAYSSSYSSSSRRDDGHTTGTRQAKPMLPAKQVTETQRLIEESKRAAANATPSPAGSAMELLKRVTAGKGNGTPAPEPPPPREPGQDEDEIEDLADSNDLDLEASSLGMKRMAFENDDALQARITARRALG